MKVNKQFVNIFSAIMILITIAVIPVAASSDEEFYDVPRVYIDTLDGNGELLVKSDGYVEAQIKVIDTDGSTIDSSGQIKVRGNSTAEVEKKSYTIKFDSKQNVFDMGAAKKWILQANCLDPTLIRNSLAFDLAENLNLSYTSKHLITEVWLDGNYLGSYDFVEPIEVKSVRVNIDTDGLQDFLLEYESTRDEEDEIYLSVDTWRFRVEAPELPDAEQLTYIENVMTNITNALKSDDYSQVEQCIDTESFAKFYLVNETFKNVDFGYSSVYFYYKNGKLYAGPVWDFDRTLGNVNPNRSEGYTRAADPTGLFAVEKHFYTYLFKYEEFYQKFIDIYTENYHYIKNIYALNGQIDVIIKRYKNVFERNFSEAGWDVSKIYNKYVRTPDATYQENVEYLKNWLGKRNEWMAEYYGINTENLVGDINVDGIFNVSDIVLLQKWLLAVPSTELSNWQAADLYEDGVIDVFDLVMMKRKLING